MIEKFEIEQKHQREIKDSYVAGYFDAKNNKLNRYNKD